MIIIASRTAGVIASFALLLAACTGCQQKMNPTGFLSDYENLEPDGPQRLAYIGPMVGEYSEFIIEPIQAVSYDDKAPNDKERRMFNEIANDMHNEIVNALAGHYEVVGQPGPGVARLRVAVTDIKKGSPALNILPQTKLTGVGLGGASMEAELVDSQTGEQLAAVIQSRQGSRFSLSGLSETGDAKAVMKIWAVHFRQMLDAAHGKQ